MTWLLDQPIAEDVAFEVLDLGLTPVAATKAVTAKFVSEYCLV